MLIYTSEIFGEVFGKERENVEDKLLKHNVVILKELGGKLEEIRNKLNTDILSPYEFSLSAYKKQMTNALSQIVEVKEKAIKLGKNKKELALNYIYVTAEHRMMLRIKPRETKLHNDYKRYKHNCISRLKKIHRQLIKNYKNYKDIIKKISDTDTQKAFVLEVFLGNIGNMLIDVGRTFINKSIKLLSLNVTKNSHITLPSVSLKEYKIDELKVLKVTSSKPKGKLNEKAFTLIFNRMFNNLKEGSTNTEEKREYTLRALRHPYAIKVFIGLLSKITSPTHINSLAAFNELSELITVLLTSLLNVNGSIGKEIVVILLSCRYLIMKVSNILILGERSMHE
jgi:2C-methyl-D-erythritol 2,4-cyclodiphosphate synthase